MKTSAKKSLLLISLIFFLSACGSIDGQNYVNSKPEFDLREFFTGNVQAWGLVQDRSGNVIRQFDVDIVGTWEGNQGELVEDFVYYDGETQRRIWRIKDLGDGRFEGRADDILDKADGLIFGNAGQWTYSMDLPVDGRTIRLKFDDWMWAMNDGVLINRSYMKKFGFVVAEITIFMKKQ